MIPDTTQSDMRSFFYVLKRSATKAFKTDKGYEQWRKKWPERLAELEDELSILNDPGEYDSLPAAVVAEELGLNIGLVESLIYCGDAGDSAAFSGFIYALAEFSSQTEWR